MKKNERNALMWAGTAAIDFVNVGLSVALGNMAAVALWSLVGVLCVVVAYVAFTTKPSRKKK